ncbi:hypothetical protein CU663_10235 [Pseudomonas syringae pv. actinidifoliorum]|nr:hypothetical protein [Pseudomonas syringae pv. actinidifoliorum]
MRPGVYWHGFKRGGADEEENEDDASDRPITDEWISTPVTVVARTTNSDDGSEGRLLRLATEGGIKEWIIAMEVFGGSGEDARRALFGMGVIIALKKRGTFMEYLLDQRPDEMFATTEPPGWHESGAFVLPGRTLGSAKVRYQASNKAQVLFSTRGELDGWKSEVAAKCEGNPVLTLAIGCALAGPLLSLVGVLGGYSTSDLDLSRGTTGKVASYYAGAYGTWLSDDGYYVDGVLKLNRFRNKADVAMSDASKAKGDYGNTGVGGWVEVGRHIKLADDYFLEPFAQLSSVVVQGQELRLDNGMKAKNARTRSVLGKVGTSLGRTVALKDGGVLQPYVRVAVAQEFSRRNEVKANDVKFDNSLFGSRGELGAGVSVSLSERLKLHADVDYMKGQHIEQPWGANVGLRLTF